MDEDGIKKKVDQGKKFVDEGIEKSKDLIDKGIEKGKKKIHDGVDKGKKQLASHLQKIKDINPELVNNFEKKTEKTKQDLFKDIEIKRENFVIIVLIAISIGSVLALNIKVGLSAIQAFRIAGVSLFNIGFIVGVITAAVVIDKLKDRFRPLIIILSFSGVSLLLELYLQRNPDPTVIEAVLSFVNSLIIGSSIIFIFVLFIEFTTILERGRVFGLLVITVATMILPIIALAYNDNLIILPTLAPILTAVYLYKKKDVQFGTAQGRGSDSDGEGSSTAETEVESEEVIDKEEEEQVGKLQLVLNRNYVVNVLLIIAFAVIIGLIFPYENAANVITTEIFQEHFFMMVVLLIVIIDIIAFVLGIIFDYWGRRTTISLFILAIGAMNFSKMVIDQRGIAFSTQYALFSFILIIQLGMLIPLTIAEIVKPNIYGRATATSLFLGIAGLFAGVAIQALIDSIPFIQALTSFFCILALFALVHIKESISRIEMEWQEALYHLYIIHESGILIYDHSFVDEKLASSDLVSGGIIGLTTMLKEITKSKDRLRTIDHGNKKIMFLWSENGDAIYVLVTKYELVVLRNKLEAFAEKFEEYFGEEQLKLSGGLDVSQWEDTKYLINEFFYRKNIADEIMKDARLAFSDSDDTI